MLRQWRYSFDIYLESKTEGLGYGPLLGSIYFGDQSYVIHFFLYPYEGVLQEKIYWPDGDVYFGNHSFDFKNIGLSKWRHVEMSMTQTGGASTLSLRVDGVEALADTKAVAHLLPSSPSETSESRSPPTTGRSTSTTSSSRGSNLLVVVAPTTIAIRVDIEPRLLEPAMDLCAILSERASSRSDVSVVVLQKLRPMCRRPRVGDLVEQTVHGFRQMLRVELHVGCHCDSASNGGLEFANVVRPVIATKGGHERERHLAIRMPVLFEQVANQHVEIFFALSKRRQAKRIPLNAREEVRAERSGFDHGLEILVCGAHEPNIDVLAARGA
jgi:hypothetical protein